MESEIITLIFPWDVFWQILENWVVLQKILIKQISTTNLCFFDCTQLRGGSPAWARVSCS